MYVLVLGSVFGCEYSFGWFPAFAYNQYIFLHFKECIIESDYLELSPEKFCATRTGIANQLEKKLPMRAFVRDTH